MKTREGNIWKVRSHADKLNFMAYIQGLDFAKYRALPTRCTVCFVSQLVRKPVGFNFPPLREILVMRTSKPKPLTSTSSITNFEFLVTLAKIKSPLLSRCYDTFCSHCMAGVQSTSPAAPCRHLTAWGPIFSALWGAKGSGVLRRQSPGVTQGTPPL